MLKTKERIICCIIAAIMFFMGMCLETTKADSSFSCATSTSTATISSVDYLLADVENCTLDMLNKSTLSIRGSIANSISKWQSRAVLLFFVVGEFLQYLFYYQSEECKEDGQLLLCRSVAVNYIHLKDGEK